MTRPAEAARRTQRKSPPFKEVFNYFDDNEDYDATNLKEVIIKVIMGMSENDPKEGRVRVLNRFRGNEISYFDVFFSSGLEQW